MSFEEHSFAGAGDRSLIRDNYDKSKDYRQGRAEEQQVS